MLIQEQQNRIKLIQSKQNYIRFSKQIFDTNSEKTQSAMLIQDKPNHSNIKVEMTYLGCRDTIRSG